ncbi:MAG: hypothetical protein AAF658_17435 [Myxococcota bacterium]
MRTVVVTTCAALLWSSAALAQEDEEISAAPTPEEPTQLEEQPEEPTAPAAPIASDGRSPIDGVVGHYGFGYFTGAAPLGVRYWLDRDTAIDLGFDLAFSSGDAEALRFGVEAGYVMSLAHYHYSIVFARLGAGFRTIDAFESGVGAIYNVNANAFLGAELFLGAFGFPNISLQGGYGLEFEYTNEGGSAFFVSAVDAGLDVTGSGQVGFHIYW